MLVDYDKQSIRKNLDNTYLSAQIERLKKEIESFENRNPKITKEYLEKKIMIYRLYKYNLDKHYDYSLVIAPVVADLCTTPVALSAPPNSYQNNSQS
mgnify:FL=1